MFRRLLVMGFAVLMLSSLAVAQGAREMNMLLRTDGKTTSKDVSLMLKAALSDEQVRDAGVKGAFDPPRPASEEVYFQMLEWIEGIRTENSIIGGPIQISRFARQSDEWNLNLGIPDNSLLELSVTMDTNGQSAKEEKFVVGQGPDANLRYHSQGRYNIKLPADAKPLRYKAKIRDGKSGEVKEFAGEWPIANGYYFVRFSSFEGDEKVLFKRLQEGAAGQKVEQIYDTRSLRVVLADFLPAFVPTGLFFKENRLIVREPMPDGLANVKRVWMQFPLKDEDAKQRWSKLAKLERDEVSQTIRKEPNVPIEAGASVVLPPTYSAPSWFELAPIRDTSGKVTHFEREFLFDNVGKWKEITQGVSSVWRLIVFEFDNGQLQYALGVTHPTRAVNTYVVDQEIPDWVIGVTERLK